MQQQNGSISSILGTGMNAPSALSPRQRQQIDPPPLQLKNTTNNDDDDNASRARLYKAEAYEAKIRIASQEVGLGVMGRHSDTFPIIPGQKIFVVEINK